MMIVACVCTADGGLQEIYVGSGTLDADGYIMWSERQTLSLFDEFDLTVKPQLVAGEVFADATAPKPALDLVEDETEATGSADRAPTDGESAKLKLVRGSSAGQPGTGGGEALNPSGGAAPGPDRPSLA